VIFSRPLPDPFLRGKGLLAFNIFLIIFNIFFKKSNFEIPSPSILYPLSFQIFPSLSPSSLLNPTVSLPPSTTHELAIVRSLSPAKSHCAFSISGSALKNPTTQPPYRHEQPQCRDWRDKVG